MRFIRVDRLDAAGSWHIRYTGIDERGAVQLDVRPVTALGRAVWDVKLAFYARGHSGTTWHSQDIAAVIARAYEQQKALASTGRTLPHTADGVLGDPPCVAASFVDIEMTEEKAA